MRSILVNKDIEFNLQSLFEVENDNFHHLVKVCRIREKEEVLILNGHGLKVKSFVDKVGERAVFLKIDKIEKIQRSYHFDLAIGLPKREYFEDCLRICCEMGVAKIIPLQSHFSQKMDLNTERLSRVLESSLIQSNNLFLPEICDSLAAEEWQSLCEKYQRCWLAHNYCHDFNSVPDIKTQADFTKNQLLIIGPEGGFSEDEVKKLSYYPHCKIINFPTPIMKSSTALAALVASVLHFSQLTRVYSCNKV